MMCSRRCQSFGPLGCLCCRESVVNIRRSMETNSGMKVNPYPPKPVSGRYLSFDEREEIAVGLAAGHSQAQIARDLGRDPSTICREIKRNSTSMKSHKPSAGLRYRARFAQYQADQQARRPKSCRLAGHPRLRDEVQAGLTKHWSPEQITSRLIVDFPNDEGGWICCIRRAPSRPEQTWVIPTCPPGAIVLT
jgi:hypothetical protein